MRLEISKLLKRLPTTMIYITHDQVEAMTMADKIVVLPAGVAEQVASPLDLCHRSCNAFVARFVGSPKMNLIEDPDAGKYQAWSIGTRPRHTEVNNAEGAWKGVVGVAETSAMITKAALSLRHHAQPLHKHACQDEGGKSPTSAPPDP